MRHLRIVLAAAAFLATGPGCKSRGPNSTTAGVFADSDAGLVVLFAPDDERVCAVACDGERLATAYAAGLPLDPRTQCTTVMRCATAAELEPQALRIDACAVKAAQAPSFIEAVRAQRVANAAAKDARVPCEPELQALVATLLGRPDQPLTGVDRLATELKVSAATALDWLAARGYLVDAGDAARPIDPTTVADVVRMKDELLIRLSTAKSVAASVSDLGNTLSAAQALRGKLVGTVETARRDKETRDRLAAEAAARAEAERVAAETKRVQDEAAEKRRRVALYEKLRNNGSRCYEAEKSVVRSGYTLTTSGFGARLYFRPSETGFEWHMASIIDGKTLDDTFAPKDYVCAYARCTGPGAEPITIDEDGDGFTMTIYGRHYVANFKC
jgi:hypothetical protein